jgi:putative ABC transport system permease protein
MNILNKLTKNSLKLNHKRTLVTCIGIILSTALICAVAGMVTSFQQTLIVATKKTEGNYHVRFENVLKDDLTYIEKNDKVKSYFLTNNIGYSKVKSKNENKPYVYVIGFSNDAFNNMGLTLEEGKFPSNNNEIVIPSHLINNGEVNLKIGDKLTLNYGIRTLDDKELNQSNSYDD